MIEVPMPEKFERGTADRIIEWVIGFRPSLAEDRKKFEENKNKK